MSMPNLPQPGHNAHRCFKGFNKNFKTPKLQIEPKLTQNALSANQANSVDVSQWLPDSSVSSRMIGDLSLFHTYTSYTNANIVLIGNGHHLPIQYIGSIILHTSHGQQL